MRKGMALLVLREKMRDPIDGLPGDDKFLFSAIDFLNSVDLESLTEENILDKYVAFLEELLVPEPLE